MLQQQGKGREALEALNRALDIQKRIYGKSHPLVAGLIFEMARLLKSMAEVSVKTAFLKSLPCMTAISHDQGHFVVAA